MSLGVGLWQFSAVLEIGGFSFANHHPEISVLDGLHPRMPEKSVVIRAVAVLGI